jgi:hypothetical protein
MRKRHALRRARIILVWLRQVPKGQSGFSANLSGKRTEFMLRQKRVGIGEFCAQRIPAALVLVKSSNFDGVVLKNRSVFIFFKRI